VALDVIDLTTWTKAYTGTKWTGNGVGLSDGPNPGFATWRAYATPPAGITECPAGWWLHGSHFFMVHNGGAPAIHRYSISASGALTHVDTVAFTALGLAGSKFSVAYRTGCAFYDAATGTVILVSEPDSGTGNTPIARCWDCAGWPFTNTSQEWSSSLAQSYGSFVSGQLARAAACWRGSGRFFMASHYAGQVFTLDDSTGAVLGSWEFRKVYDGSNNQFRLLGADSSGNPYGGSYHVNGGNRDLWKWNVSDLDNWVTDTKIMENSGDTAAPWGPAYKRVLRDLYGDRYVPKPVQADELAQLGWTGSLAWWMPTRYTQYGEPLLLVYDPATNEYSERPMAGSSARRAVGNASHHFTPPAFIRVNGVMWMVSFSEFSQDIEDESPGTANQMGLVFTAIGPGVVKFSKTLAADTTPRRLQPTIPLAAKNYLFSTHWAKHGARYRVNAGTWSDWRYGEQELSHLDSVVSGKAAWPAWSSGDAVEIEWKLSAGWPQALDSTCYQNPGEVGDPDQLPTNTADVGPPREVVPVLFADASEVVHTIIGIEATATVGDGIHATVEVG